MGDLKNFDPAIDDLPEGSKPVFNQNIEILTEEGKYMIRAFATVDGIAISPFDSMSPLIQLKGIFQCLEEAHKSLITNFNDKLEIRWEKSTATAPGVMNITLTIKGLPSIVTTHTLKPSIDRQRYIYLIEYDLRQINNENHLKVAIAACILGMNTLGPIIEKMQNQ